MKDSGERYAFVLALVLISAAFLFMMLPFFGVVLWACIISLMFRPVYLFLVEKFKGRENLAALMTLSLCLLIVVLPGIFTLGSIIQQGLEFYRQLDNGEIDPTTPIQFLNQHIPFLENLLEKYNIEMSEVKEKIIKHAMNATQAVAKNSFSIGSDTVQFLVNLSLFAYISFFFIRDGQTIVKSLLRVFPLGAEQTEILFSKFKEVTRATIKGNLVIAGMQGVLGGVIFGILGLPGALLWGALMIILSLVPVVGAALVWVPASLFLLATGQWEKGVILVLFGAFVIGLVDNILRPLLVGKDTKLPDYLVLLSTLGGLSLFGPNGFILGPLIAVLFMTIWQMFEKE